MERENKGNYQFEGFDSPNYTPVPDAVFDRLLKRLSGAEIKVLFYIIRRTFGFKKQSDDISLNQICNGIRKKTGEVLDDGTGLSQRQVIRALKVLAEMSIIHAIRNKSQIKGYEPTTYSLNFKDGGAEATFRHNVRRVDKATSEMSEALLTRSQIQETVVQENVNVPFNTTERKNEPVKQAPNGKNGGYRVDFAKLNDTEANLFGRIIEVCQDRENGANYLNVIRTHPENILDMVISETRQADREGRIKKTAGAYFMDTLKRITDAREQAKSL